MKESTLFKISLTFAILGIAALFFVSTLTEFPEGGLLEEDGSYVIEGTIKRINQMDKVTYINLEKQDELTVILFKDYPVDLNAGDYVEVIGKASKTDEGEIQLIGKEVRVVK